MTQHQSFVGLCKTLHESPTAGQGIAAALAKSSRLSMLTMATLGGWSGGKGVSFSLGKLMIRVVIVVDRSLEKKLVLLLIT